jgi:hypothetical protein
MQSVIVKSKSNFKNTLVANIKDMTIVDEGTTLRSSDGSNNPEVLYIDISKDGIQKNTTALIYNPGKGNNYFTKGLDVPKMFLQTITEPVTVYTASSDGMALDIQQMGDVSQSIPVGIRTSEQGRYRILFRNLSRFMPNYNVYLNEITGNTVTQTDLRETGSSDIFVFEKNSDDLFLSDRFYLTFELKNPASISDNVKQSGISVAQSNNRVKFISTDGSNLVCIALFDLQGHLIFEQENINNPVFEIPVGVNQIYIARAASEKSTASFKLYVK